jgi:hypothetical protein
MTVAEVIQIITAVAACITAIGGVIIAIRTGLVKKTLDETHVMLNQQRTDMYKYQEDLVKTLQDAGIAIPTDSSLKPKT